MTPNPVPVQQLPAKTPQTAGKADVSLARSCWTLYRLSLGQHRHGRRWIGTLALTLLPMLIAIIIRSTDPYAAPGSMEFGLVFMLIPQGLLPLLALVYASGIIQEEQEDQTITYLLVRPIPKWMMYLIKWAAALTAAEILAMAAIVLTYAAIFCGTHGASGSFIHLAERCLVACTVHGLAILAYCGIFGLMGLVTQRVLVIGILYTALFEGLFANTPFNLRMITVIYYARLLIYRLLPHHAKPGLRVHSTTANTWKFITAGDPNLKLYPHNWVCVTVLLSTAIFTSALAGWICSNREFYVKTPNKTD